MPLLKNNSYLGPPTKVNVGLEGRWMFDPGTYLGVPLGNGSGVTKGLGRPFFNRGKYGSYKSAGGDYVNDGILLYPFTLTSTPLLSTDFSISAWFKTAGANNRGVIFTNVAAPATIKLALTLWTSKLSVWPTDAGPTLLSTTSVDDNKWHHGVVTSSASLNTTRIYLDGYLNCTPTTSIVATRTYAAFIVGNLYQYTNAAYTFDGEIDDVRYYSRALTASEVSMLYNEAFNTAINYEMLPALTVAAAPSFIAAWARQSNLPVIGAGTY